MWNLRNLTDERTQKNGRKNKIKRDREASHKRLLNTENELRVAGGVLWGEGLDR